MPAPSDIIGDHKKHYLQRLINRNPQLHFFRGSSRLDLSEIFEGILRNSPNVLGGERASRAAPTSPEQLLADLCSGDDSRALTIKGVARKVQARLEKLTRTAEDARHLSGQHTLFIGYPLLYAPVFGNKVMPILAPLFFIPIVMESRGPDLHLRRLADAIGMQGDAAELRPNALLNQWAQVTHDVTLETEASLQYLLENCSFNDATELSSAFAESVKLLFRSWRGVESDEIGFAALEHAPTREEAKKWLVEQLPPRVLNAAVVGAVEFRGQALLDDLGKLENLTRDPRHESPLLGLFVKPRQSHEDPGPIENPSESDRWLISESDPSQERAVWHSRNAPLVVIQGPPGTGKSQTIVNLIADALSRGKKVAVVSQKRAALEVIQKRLDGKGLGDLCKFIDDPVKQRATVIKAVKECTQDWTDAGFTGLAGRRQERATQIEKSEEKIEAGLKPFHSQGIERPRYADCMARLVQLRGDRFQSNRIGWNSLVHEISSVLPADREMWPDLIRQIRALSDQALECRYHYSPWRRHRMNIHFERAASEQRLTDIINYLRLQDSIAPLHSTISMDWLVAHPFTKGYVATFLTETQRSAQIALQTAMDGLHWFAGKLEIANSTHWSRMAYERTLVADDWESLLRSIGRAGDVKKTREQLDENKVAQVLDKHFSDYLQDWHHLVEAAAHESARRDLETAYPGCYEGVSHVKQELQLLERRLQEKQSDDRLHLRWRFRRRVTHSNRLTQDQLLRLRGNRTTRTRKTEIRDIFSKGFESFSELYPVVLASPEIGCSILPLEQGLFDLVIFDEASQMYMAEAIPFLHRGKVAVIAGDSKQMPPSDFFTLADDEDGYENDWDDDVKSDATPGGLIAAHGEFCLIDAAEQALPHGVDAQRMLMIHYRSAAKELIDFSNHAFYEGKLLAPPGNPAVNPLLPRPIVYQKLPGEFSGGVNRVEAERIVSFLRLLWRETTTPTVGVIVFNIKQKAEVERQIEDLARVDREFSKRWLEEREREDNGEDVGFFIRSVEHVQGDERDLIILATTYAGDSRNFGPLTKKEKGRRRLNVAITRAKRGMLVLSSLNLDAMAPEGDEERDGRFLQLFLRYAKAVSENDKTAVDATLGAVNPKRKIAGRAPEYDSPFEKEVHDFLTSNGYDVDTQVGETGFRIDLAVRVPNGAGYLCGIECDGAQYHTGWRARTNDIWRQHQLESKGWKIFRVWSTDWFSDPAREKAKISEHLKDLREQAEAEVSQLHKVLRTFAMGSPESVDRSFGGTSKSDPANLVQPMEPHPVDIESEAVDLGIGEHFEALQRGDEEVVEIGDTVDYCFVEEPNEILTVMIGLANAPNLSAGVIPANTPLAKLLRGKAVDDEACLSLPPKGKRNLRILAIRKP